MHGKDCTFLPLLPSFPARRKRLLFEMALSFYTFPLKLSANPLCVRFKRGIFFGLLRCGEAFCLGRSLKKKAWQQMQSASFEKVNCRQKKNANVLKTWFVYGMNLRAIANAFLLRRANDSPIISPCYTGYCIML